MDNLDRYVLAESARTFTLPVAVSPNDEPATYADHILAALQRKPMYEGTVPHDVVAKRRAANKRARAARRLNR